MQIATEVLENRFVRLEPMGDQHKEALRAACEADQDIWTRLYPFSWAGEHFEPTWTMLTTHIAQGQTIGFAVMVGQALAGLTCFSGMDAANAVVEIGGTYYAPDHRGGAVNPAAKRLMMGHAFACGAQIGRASCRERV